jgi:hypothetical protein
VKTALARVFQRAGAVQAAAGHSAAAIRLS